MKKIAFCMQKGGVGKTSITGHIGVGLSILGYNVLLIDNDPQGNLSTWMCKDAKNSIKNELVSYLKEECELDEVRMNIRKNLDLLPTKSGSISLKNYSETTLVSSPFDFIRLMKQLENQSNTKYDFVLTDLSPSFGLLENRMISANNETIAVLTPEIFSIYGIKTLSDFIIRINKQNEAIDKPHILFNKIILNNYNKTFKSHNSLTQGVMSIDGFITMIVPQDKNISTLQEQGLTVFDVKKSKCKQAFADIIKEITNGK